MRTSHKSTGLVAILLSLTITTGLVIGDPQEPKQKPPPQISAPIQLMVTVTNKQGFVTGLGHENFQISVDKVPARIVHFSNEDSPVSIGLMFDASASMTKFGSTAATRISILQQSLMRFFELSNKSNDYFLIGFSEKPQLLQDWTSETKLILDNLTGIKPSGNTALYDACYVGIDKLQHARHPRRALILISDGLDNNSRYSFPELRELLRETGTPFYSIHFPTNVEPGSSLRLEGKAVLVELSAPSGGMAYVGSALKQSDANEILEAIATELRKQYMIVIEPLSSDSAKKWHKIKLKVNAPANKPSALKNLSTRTREGFYSLQN